MDCMLSGTVSSCSSSANALPVKVRRGSGNTRLAAPRKWVFFMVRSVLGAVLLQPTVALFFVGKSRHRDSNFRARSKFSIEIENFDSNISRGSQA